MTARAQRALMAGPVVIGALLLVAVPLVITLALALFEYDGITSPQWVGLENLELMFGDPFLADAITASAIFVAIAVPLRLAAATGLALLLAGRGRGADVQRTAVFLPTIVPDAALALLFAWLLNPVFGPLNGALAAVGLPEPSWYASSTGAMVTFILLGVFTVGEGFIVALAARQEIDGELYEAARLEGARPWQITRRLTLPLMAPTLAILACRDVAIALQATFTAAYLITDGGPARATLFLPILIFDYGFEQFRYGYAAAITLVLYVLTGIVLFLAWRLLRRWQFGEPV